VFFIHAVAKTRFEVDRNVFCRGGFVVVKSAGKTLDHEFSSFCKLRVDGKFKQLLMRDVGVADGGEDV